MASRWGGDRATKIRAALAATLPRPCWRCGVVISPDDLWDVGHRHGRDAGGSLWDPANLAPEHRGQCNRADGARITNAKRSRRARRLR